MAMPWAPHNTENSNVTGMKAVTFSSNEKLGLPPMFMGQSWIMKYHMPSSASDVPVIAYMKEQMAKRVRLIPMMGSMPWMGNGEYLSLIHI